MDIHLPKPLHGWREFIGEVGIIVLGVLIALGAEQVAEYFRQHAELREAEQAMTSELRDDDLPQAFARVSVNNCYSGELDAIEDAVASGDRTKFQTLAKNYKPVFRTWDDEAWKAALASQVLVHSGSKRIIDWSTAYIQIGLLSQTALEEANQLSPLRARLSGEGLISAAQKDQLFQVISVLRQINNRMSVSSLIFVNTVNDLGLTLTPGLKNALLAEARKKYGACVSKPTSVRLNLNSQFSFLPRGALGKH
jgi:hypothetical protein